MKRYRIALVAGVLALAVAASAPAQEEEAKRLAAEAAELAKGGKADEALAAMKKAVGLAPTNDLYLATASELAFKAARFAEGLEYAEKAIKLNDKVGGYHVLLAANALGEQDLDRARQTAEGILKRAGEFGSGPCDSARTVLDLVLPKTYTLFWRLDPQRGQRTGNALVVALPKGELPYQTVTFEVDGAQSHRLVKGQVNDVVQIVPQGNKAVTLTTKVTVKPYSFKKDLAKEQNKPVPAEVRVFLGPSDTIDPKSPVLTKVAAGLKGTTAVDTARNVLTWMKKNIEYKLEKKSIFDLDFKSVDEIVQRGHAECCGYAMLFTALCRAAGVPARTMWGLTRVGPGQDKTFGDIASHNWSEFYVTGVGWVPVDPQRPETFGFLPTNHIRMFMDGRRSRTSADNLPLANLLSMYGGKVRFEESR